MILATFQNESVCTHLHLLLLSVKSSTTPLAYCDWECIQALTRNTRGGNLKVKEKVATQSCFSGTEQVGTVEVDQLLLAHSSLVVIRHSHRVAYL